jgi:hypothetical protein
VKLKRFFTPLLVFSLGILLSVFWEPAVEDPEFIEEFRKIGRSGSWHYERSRHALQAGPPRSGGFIREKAGRSSAGTVFAGPTTTRPGNGGIMSLAAGDFLVTGI